MRLVCASGWTGLPVCLCARDIFHFCICAAPTVAPKEGVLTQKVYGEFIRCVVCGEYL